MSKQLISFVGAYYNAPGDCICIIFRYIDYSFSTDNMPEYVNKFYFGIVKSNGTKVAFDYTQEDNYGLWKSSNTSIQNWSSTMTVSVTRRSWCCIDPLTFLTCIEWSRSDGGYGGWYSKLKFADNSYTSFTNISTGSSGCYSYSDNIDRPINFYYSGPRYGLMCSGNGWIRYPMMFKTQYPIFDGEGNRYTDDEFISNPGANANTYYMYLQSSQGLIAYVPSIPIFLGGYFEVIQNPIAVNLKPNTNNYIYLERDSSTKELKAYASTTKDIEEGSKQFSRILLARVLTNDANPIETEYYRINTGYNDYTFRKTVKVTQPEHGKIYVNDKIGTEFKFELGTDVTIKAVADNGYVVNYLDVSNGNTGGVILNPYHFIIDKDISVSAFISVGSGSAGTGKPGFIYLHIPNGIHVIKITATANHAATNDSVINYDNKKEYLHFNSAQSPPGTVITKYIGVTKDSDYTLYFNCTVQPYGEVRIEWSEEINKHAIDIEDYK